VTATREAASVAGARPRFGCLAGKIQLAPNFDEPLTDEFKDYMKWGCSWTATRCSGFAKGTSP
jgi:hypothetical protein